MLFDRIFACADDKHYVAYISYHISHKMPDDIKKKTEKVVSCIKKLMKEMNYSFYDGDLNNDADSGNLHFFT